MFMWIRGSRKNRFKAWGNGDGLKSDAFFWTSLALLGTSAVLRAAHRERASSFVRQWAPQMLALGLYGRMTKAILSRRAA